MTMFQYESCRIIKYMMWLVLNTDRRLIVVLSTIEISRCSKQWRMVILTNYSQWFSLSIATTVVVLLELSFGRGFFLIYRFISLQEQSIV